MLMSGKQECFAHQCLSRSPADREATMSHVIAMPEGEESSRMSGINN